MSFSLEAHRSTARHLVPINPSYHGSTVCTTSSLPAHQDLSLSSPYRFERSSYYNEDFKPGLSLLRARRPFLVKNAITGLSLFGMCVGICKGYAFGSLCNGGADLAGWADFSIETL